MANNDFLQAFQVGSGMVNSAFQLKHQKQALEQEMLYKDRSLELEEQVRGQALRDTQIARDLSRELTRKRLEQQANHYRTTAELETRRQELQRERQKSTIELQHRAWERTTRDEADLAKAMGEVNDLLSAGATGDIHSRIAEIGQRYAHLSASPNTGIRERARELAGQVGEFAKTSKAFRDIADTEALRKEGYLGEGDVTPEALSAAREARRGDLKAKLELDLEGKREGINLTKARIRQTTRTGGHGVEAELLEREIKALDSEILGHLAKKDTGDNRTGWFNATSRDSIIEEKRKQLAEKRAELKALAGGDDTEEPQQATPAAPVQRPIAELREIAKQFEPEAVIKQAQWAIKQGADPAKVQERLEQLGVTGQQSDEPQDIEQLMDAEGFDEAKKARLRHTYQNLQR